MYLFYHADATPGSSVLLEGTEATHITKALRKKEGDSIHLTDGKGKLFEGIIRMVKRDVEVVLTSFTENQPRSNQLELAIAPTKNQDRLEWFVEKAVEIGVEKITLLQCEHSERIRTREERLQRVAIAAMKQSLKFFLPQISNPIPFRDWVKGLGGEQKFIAHCNANLKREQLKNSLKSSSNCIIAIGPEGDFSQAEIEWAESNEFQSVSLGNSRLRTETAAMCAVHTFALINEF